MKVTIIKWRDIPSQVMVKKSRRDSYKIMLPERFQEAIDEAATVGGAAGTDAYLADWNNEIINVDSDDMQTEVDAVVAEIQEDYTDEVLQAFIQNKGYTPKDFEAV